MDVEDTHRAADGLRGHLQLRCRRHGLRWLQSKHE